MVAASISDALANSISMAEAARLLGCHIKSVWRISTRGVRGVKLETWMKSGRRVTTRSAVDSYLADLNSDHSPITGEVSEAERRGVESGRALDALGC